MDISQKKEFTLFLKDVFSSYAKPFPEGDFLSSWWKELCPFPLFVVKCAFDAYRQGGSEFVPTPAVIAKRCILCDGRPTAEEAWPIALCSRDEAETVVWTEEIAQAMSHCMPCFPDEVAARMSFKDCYNRLINNARQNGKPASWVPSLGWDLRKREAILNKAAEVGLLAAPQVTALLGTLVQVPAPNEFAREQIAKIKEMLNRADEERITSGEQRLKRERAELEARKKELSNQAGRLDDDGSVQF